jgi:GNAT superfamily N-acetyltransferase
MMKIRSAQTSDKTTVLEFCKNTFSWGDYVADVWDSWQSKGGLHVIEDDGKVIGVYNIALHEKQTWLEGMRVHPQYRLHGFGKQMLAHAESIAPHKIIRLIIESKNHPSIGLAKSMGYHLEEKWRLYSSHPEKQNSSVKVARNISEVKDLISSSTYADSWKWLPLDNDELYKLIDQKRIVVSVHNGKTLAAGIWNRSSDFPQVLQIGYVDGTSVGITDIIRYIQNMACKLGCERIQIFIQDKIPLDAKFLDKKSLFYLMRKDLPQKKSIIFERKVSM